MRPPRHGFTLVELLVVIAIIGTLMAMLIPAVQSAKEAGRRATCLNNQKELALAAINYESGKGKLPGSWGNIPGTGTNAKVAVTSTTPLVVEWPVLLFPYMSKNDIYTLIQATPVAQWTTYSWPTVGYLICPSAPPSTFPTPLSYAANCGQVDNLATQNLAPYDFADNGVFMNQYQYFPPSGTSTTSSQSSTNLVPVVQQSLSYIARWDGVSNTIMLSENLDAEQWMNEFAPNDVNRNSSGTSTEWEIGITWFAQDPPTLGLNQQGGQATLTGQSIAPQNFGRPSSGHPGGFIVAMCDGSAQFLSQQIAYRVYALLMTPHGATAAQPGTSPSLYYSNSANSPSYMSLGWTDVNGNLIPLSQTDLNQ